MALPGLDIADILSLDREGLGRYFMHYARFNHDAPKGSGHKYAIRLGSRSLFSDDTYELLIKFNKAVGLARRSHNSEARKKQRKAIARRAGIASGAARARKAKAKQ